ATHIILSIGITFSKSSVNSKFFIYEVLDVYFFVSLMVNPIVISSLAKKVIEIEEKNNMWQLQMSLGEKVPDILLNKFKKLSIKLLLVQILEWILIILLSTKSNYFSLNGDVLARLLILFL